MNQKKSDKKRVLKFFNFIFITIAFLTLLLSSCQKESEFKKGNKSEIIVADVDGQKISLNYVETRHKFFNSYISKKEFLNKIIVPQIILLQESKRLGINVSEEEVNTEFSNYKKISPLSEIEFEKYMKNLDIDEKTAKEMIKEALILEKTSNALVPEDLEISKEEMIKFYESNKEYFSKNDKDLTEAEPFIREEILSEKKQDILDKYILKRGTEKNILIFPDAIKE